jgi:hypothetical protein
LQEPDGGFSVRVSRMADVTSGWAVARKRQSLIMPVESFVDKDGKATEEGKRRLLAYILMTQDQLFDEDLPKGKRVVVGAWHEPYDPKTGKGNVIHLDVTDVYDKNILSKDEAYKLGVEQDQKSIADLNAITKGDWKNATIKTNGAGKNGYTEDDLRPYLDDIEKRYGSVKR